MVVSDAEREFNDKEVDELPSESEDGEEENGFSIGDRLVAPNATMYTTADLHSLIHEGLIDLNPPYQRDIVWTESKQVRLLDSIYRNFYVPPIVFAITMEDGEEVKRCVDGKQRLTSIQKFIDGQIPYRDPRSRKSYWWTRPDKSNKLEVPQAWKIDFAQKQITCVEYSQLSHAMERDIFQRVQLGMPLTAAEKLQAIASPWADWISVLDLQFVNNDDGITNGMNVDMRRGRNFQSLAQMVYCCHGIPDQLIPSAQKMEVWVSNTEHPEEGFKRAISDVLTEYWHLAHTSGLDDAFTKIKQRVAPIEFVFIGVLLYVMSGCTHEERAKEIYNMRTYVRRHFSDVRARSDVVKVLWNFVTSTAHKRDTGFHFNEVVPPPPKRTRKKRARGESDDEGSDYGGASTGTKSRGKKKAGAK